MNFYDLQKVATKSPKLKLRWDNKVDTFSEWLMSEVTRDIVNDLNKWARNNKEELPFHDLFGDKTRIVIPLDADPATLSILEKIKKAGLTIDFDNGFVSDGKRATRIGKYILNKISPFTQEEKDWWTHAGQAVKELKAVANNQHVIVVSRNPIDIVRMSDHDGWTSCHSPDREYFTCAVSDAKGAGAIAYVVKKKDLEDVDLQEPEIFQDRERNIHGVNPVSRIRLRKFVHKKQGYDLAVPEDRVYGHYIPGLEESVRKWAFQSQQDKMKRFRPRLKDFELMGGSYQDTIGSTLFNNFFGDELDHGDADYGGEDEYVSMFNQYQEEVNLITRQYEGKFHICSFSASVGRGEEEPYVSYSGSVRVEIPEELVINKEFNRYQVREAVHEWARENDIYEISDLDVDNSGATFEIFDSESDHGPDDFRSFLENTLKDIDEKRDDLKVSFYYLYLGLGLAKETRTAYLSNNWDEHPHQFQNFVWEGDEPEVMISLKDSIILPPPPPEWNWDTLTQETLKKLIMKEINAWADRVHASQQKQLGLFKDAPLEHKRPFSGEFKIRPEISFGPSASWQQLQPNQPVYMRMRLNFDTFSKDEDVNDAIDFVTFLDRNFSNFVSMIQNNYRKLFI